MCRGGLLFCAGTGFRQLGKPHTGREGHALPQRRRTGQHPVRSAHRTVVDDEFLGNTREQTGQQEDTRHCGNSLRHGVACNRTIPHSDTPYRCTGWFGDDVEPDEHRHQHPGVLSGKALRQEHHVVVPRDVEPRRLHRRHHRHYVRRHHPVGSLAFRLCRGVLRGHRTGVREKSRERVSRQGRRKGSAEVLVPFHRPHTDTAGNYGLRRNVLRGHCLRLEQRLFLHRSETRRGFRARRLCGRYGSYDARAFSCRQLCHEIRHVESA